MIRNVAMRAPLGAALPKNPLTRSLRPLGQSYGTTLRGPIPTGSREAPGWCPGSPPVRKNRLSEETSGPSRLNYADARDGRRIGLTLIGHYGYEDVGLGVITTRASPTNR